MAFHRHLFAAISTLALLAALAPPVASRAADPDRTAADDVQAETVVSQLSSGWDHSCALTTAGGVLCWGDNSNGQLGDGTTDDRSVPRYVVGLTSNVSAIASGALHTCALTTAGGVKCWGNNDNGQLGDNSDIDRWTPVDVLGLTSGVSAIAAGDAFTCAIVTGDGLECWGDNAHGQLGNNSTVDRWTAGYVSGLTSGINAVTAGAQHTCARISSDNSARCWGENTSGQLGDNSTTDRWTPVWVVGTGSLTIPVRGLAAGAFHTCLRTSWDGAMCWGENGDGQVGDGTNQDRHVPTAVSGLTSGIGQIATGGCGGNHSCARTNAGGVKCWGLNWAGALGDGTDDDRQTPVDVYGLTSGTSYVNGGGYHTCAVIAAGGVKCWGDNGDGQLGDGGTTDRWTPVNVLLQAVYVPTIVKMD